MEPPPKRQRGVDYANIDFEVNQGYVDALDNPEVVCVAIRKKVIFDDDDVREYKPNDMKDLVEVGELLDDTDDTDALLEEVLPVGRWVRPFQPFKQVDLSLAALAALLDSMPSGADPAVDPYPLPAALVTPGWSLALPDTRLDL